jgi:RNA polymerase-interacting CarD/CdnL/TRCF family regulator
MNNRREEAIMQDEFGKDIEAIVVRIEAIAAEFRRLREAYEREPDAEERRKLTNAVNRLNEELSGIKLRAQAEKTLPIPPKKATD